MKSFPETYRPRWKEQTISNEIYKCIHVATASREIPDREAFNKKLFKRNPKLIRYFLRVGIIWLANLLVDYQKALGGLYYRVTKRSAFPFAGFINPTVGDNHIVV